VAISFDSQRLAELVRNYRDREGLSLREMGEITELGFSTISRIENQDAKKTPDMDTIIRLINLCNFKLEEILPSDTPEDKARVEGLSTQLRASKEISRATLEALEAVIREVRIQTTAQEAANTRKGNNT
jgi:transcriptional regulator with XRE-family HTH domain